MITTMNVHSISSIKVSPVAVLGNGRQWQEISFLDADGGQHTVVVFFADQAAPLPSTDAANEITS